MRLRKDIILDLLSQVGRNFQNLGVFLRDKLDVSRWWSDDTLAPVGGLCPKKKKKKREKERKEQKKRGERM